MAADCVFCARARGDDLLFERETTVAFADGYPLTAGHTLVVPRRHCEDLFALSLPEQQAVWLLVADVREELVRRYRPDGFNVGLNLGPAAGQTVRHTHVHVIPRYAGDVSDPRGGVRWVVPERAAYWA
jgi:diadenosine tetraphosphate (Ap4A) HIT family hydrolase